MVPQLSTFNIQHSTLNSKIMDIIHLLPDSVANQIAAGEVIQRPASVVKELVENSIDAGASLVKVVIKGAGRTSILVIDDGKGMSATDARLAFLNMQFYIKRGMCVCFSPILPFSSRVLSDAGAGVCVLAV